MALARGYAMVCHRLALVTFDLICNMTMFVQNGFWTLRSHRGYIKILNVFLQSPSIELSPVKVSRF